MALARTSHGAWSSDHGYTADPFVAGSSFTPSNNSFLVVVATGEDVQGWNAGVTLAGGSLTWTRQVSVQGRGSDLGLAIFTAPVATGVSTTLTLSGYTEAGALYMRAYDYTGYDTADPIDASITYGIETPDTLQTALSIALDAAPAASSEVFAALAIYSTSNAVPGAAGFTERSDDVLPVGWHETQVQTRTGSTSTTVDWTHDSIQESRRVAAAIEIVEAAGGTVVITASKGFVLG